jgi:glycosyltransferase involved in cell wall biosynthesis
MISQKKEKLDNYPSIGWPEKYAIDDSMVLPPSVEPREPEVIRGPNIKPLPRRGPMEQTLHDHERFTSSGRLRIEVIWYNILGKQLYANHIISQLKALAKRGYDIAYVTACASGFESGAATTGFHLYALPLRKIVPGVSLILFQLVAFYHLLRSIGRCAAVILDPDTLPIVFPILLVHRFTGRLPAVFLRISTNPLPWRKGVESFLRTLYDSLANVVLVKLSIGFLDKIFFISPMLAESYSTRFNIPKAKTAVWPVAVDLSVFRDRSKTKVNRLRKELGVARRVGVLYHGAIAKSRGIIDLAEASEILNTESVNVTLILLGDGAARKDIEEFVRQNHLEEIIQLRGPVNYSEVPDFIAACDVGIIPLPDEPWWRNQPALKLLEYLAMNKPVIVSDIPAHRWIVDNDRVALYLHGTNPHDIAEGIRAFLLSRDRFDTTEGRRIAERFSMEKTAETVDHELISAINHVLDAERVR